MASKGYLFDTNNLIRALFDENTAEGQLLDAANAGYIEILLNQSRGMRIMADYEYHSRRW
ncbi:MAG: hypothetical protein CM15mP47_5060 [Methanobacteriota archaeon]|nr:MAG: hypothetical protein CM15mP47_5060 [Euryarchaeota archaeon]